MSDSKDGYLNLSEEDHRYLLYVFLFAIIVLSVPVAVFFGYLPRGLAGPLESAVLIVVTFAYLLQTKVMADEMREERRLSRETLQEMRKEQGLNLIVHVIEPLITDLGNHRSSWRELEPSSDGQSFPELMQMLNTPNEDLLEDLDEQYSNAVTEISEYQNLLRLYQERRQILLTDLEEYIENEYLGVLVERNRQELEELIEEEQHVGDDQSPRDIISANADDLARAVLELELSHRHAGYRLRLWELLRDDLLELRSTNQFEEKFEEIEKFIDDLKAKNDYLSQRVGETKNAFMDQYEINQSEVREKLEQISMRETDQGAQPYTF